MYQHRLVNTKPIILLLVLVAIGASTLVGVSQLRGNPGEAEYVTHNELLRRVADDVPEFGGYFLDESGRSINVYMTDASRSNNAVSALRTRIGSSVTEGRAVNVLPARFSMRDLVTWYDSLRPNVWDLEGIVRTDLAEQANEIRIGVESSSHIPAVRRLASSIGVPQDAMNVRVEEPTQPMLDDHLQDEFTDLQGGIQIKATGSGACTLGFVAKRDGVLGFVTASHCSKDFVSMDSGYWFQPDSFTLPKVGVEVVDPTPLSGPVTSPDGLCDDSDDDCRWSDSTFIDLDSGVSADLGYIARPTAVGGAIDIDDDDPQWEITSDSSTYSYSDFLNKVGKTTGQSVGPVDATCTDETLFGVIFMCQGMVLASSNTGDSGSPVFRKTSSTEVELVGVLWGRSGSRFVFAPIGQVYQDLGVSSTWDVCSPGNGC